MNPPPDTGHYRKLLLNVMSQQKMAGDTTVVAFAQTATILYSCNVSWTFQLLQKADIPTMKMLYCSDHLTPATGFS